MKTLATMLLCYTLLGCNTVGHQSRFTLRPEDVRQAQQAGKAAYEYERDRQASVRAYFERERRRRLFHCPPRYGACDAPLPLPVPLPPVWHL